MPARRGTGRADAADKGTPKRRRKSRPPWGNLFGGKPIERWAWYYNQKVDLGDDLVLRQRHMRMLQLKEYYGIFGGNFDYPIEGVGPSDWVPWYKLALAIASELDDSLKIVDAKPCGKTSPRWRGVEGRVLLSMVKAYRDIYPGRSTRWCLSRLLKQNPAFAKSLAQLEVRYYEAKKHFDFGTTKRQRNHKAAS